MRRFYRYLIYRLFIWRVQQKDNTPAFSVTFIITISHFFILAAIYSYLIGFYLNVKTALNFSKLEVSIFFILFLFLHFLLLNVKKTYNRFSKEFENESRDERRRGTIKMIIFLSGSVGILLVVWLILIFK